MPGLRHEAQVMLRLRSPDEIRGHFLRLASEANWQDLVLRVTTPPRQAHGGSRAASSASAARTGTTPTCPTQRTRKSLNKRSCGKMRNGIGRKWRDRKKQLEAAVFPDDTVQHLSVARGESTEEYSFDHEQHDTHQQPLQNDNDTDSDSFFFGDPFLDDNGNSSDENKTDEMKNLGDQELCQHSQKTEGNMADKTDESLIPHDDDLFADPVQRAAPVPVPSAAELLQQEEEETALLDTFSEVSDCSDIFHVQEDPDRDFVTEEDKDLELIDALAEHLRDYPLLPPDAKDKTRSFMDVQSGQRLPTCHCAFKNCTAPKKNTVNGIPYEEHWGLEKWVFDHLKAHHADAEMKAIYELRCQGETHANEMTLLAYYMAAVRQKEREHLPLIGPSVDRRSLALVHKLCNSSTVESMMCTVCAQIHTHVSCWDRMWHVPGADTGIRPLNTTDSTDKELLREWRQRPENRFHKSFLGEINLYPVRQSFFKLLSPHEHIENDKLRAKKKDAAWEVYQRNLVKAIFVQNFASGSLAAPWQNCTELRDDDHEWQRSLHVDGSCYNQELTPREDRIICCPEDIRRCKTCKQTGDRLCGDCRVPLCNHCYNAFDGYRPFIADMGLCNDNLWGYVTDIIYRHKVRWLEMAVVAPVWTSMMIFYVEGDGGHLFNEVLQARVGFLVSQLVDASPGM